MRGWKAPLFLLIILLAAGCISVVSASDWSITNLTIYPSGNLKAGDDVKISFTVAMQSEFDASDELSLSTDLGTSTGTTRPTWAHTIYVDGVENAGSSEAGKTIYISGWDISYKRATETDLAVTLQGTVQPVSSTTNITLLTVKEINSAGNTLKDTVFTKTATIISTAQITAGLSTTQSNLSQFRSDIDDKSAIGVDVSTAEAKYSAASSALSSAQGRTSSDYSTALQEISSAETYISDGETLLNKAWAEKVISDAQVPMTKVNALINFFKVNLSMSADPRVSSLVSSEETAEQYLSSANDFLAQSNYDQVRIKANQAFEKANQTYTDALALNSTVGSSITSGGGINLGSITKPITSNLKFILIGVVIVIIIVGILYWRSRSRWDELG